MSEAKPKVLVIEDNDASASDYVRWLRADGYVVERASARKDGIEKAAQVSPEVILLDLQIPSAPDRADEDVQHGIATLEALLDVAPFRPVVVITAHSRDREIMRRVLQQNRGGAFVFKDADDLEREMLKAVVVALKSPAYRMSKTVAEFRALVDRNEKEDEYRKFIHRHWDVILGPEYKSCESPYEISRGMKVDLLAVRQDGFADLWELKRPSDSIFSDYNGLMHHSVECARAIGQIMQYHDAAAREPRQGLLHHDMRRGVSMELHRPRSYVVIGRYRDARERERLRLENSFLAGLAILTYDDLIERAEQLLGFLSRYRNGEDHG
ncbi:Shedu anti-phage system protein SduA domain-containing protein [Polyangium fumosum]|nr:Shedu anti-phage system protein SduA domain-containing protein [Polyangium fumosum]